MCVQRNTISPEQNLIGLLTPISASYGYQAIHGEINLAGSQPPWTSQNLKKKPWDSTTPKTKDYERSVGIPSKIRLELNLGRVHHPRKSSTNHH